MKEQYLDTYFFDSKLALEVALQKNRVETQNPVVKGLQICYYNGDKLKKAPKNCIHLPLDNIYSYFVKTNNRFPKFVSFQKTNFTIGDQKAFNAKMAEILNFAINKNRMLVEKYKKKVKKNKPDFSEKVLRVFVPACRETVVMQYIAKSVARAFKNQGCDVKYYIQKNDMEFCGALDNLKAQYKFNPHITFNINHLNNDYIHKDVINFTWFQDPMTILTDSSKITLRKKDFLFHIIDGFRVLLNEKGINSSFQSFCLDENVYKLRPKIKREKKIIFVGTSYKEKIKELKQDTHFNTIYDEMLKRFEEKSCLTNITLPNSDIQYFMDKYNKEEFYIGRIYAYLIRDYCLEKLCSLPNIKYKIEVYGYGWEDNEIINKFYKGPISYGKDLSKIYNSATYAYCPGAYLIMQRTLEAAGSGAIPLMLDVREDKLEKYDKEIEKSLKLFDIKDLELVLKSSKKVKRDLSVIVEKYSYNKFTKKMLATAKKLH